MLDTEDWKALMKTQRVQEIPPVQVRLPLWVAFTGVRTHAGVDPASLTLRVDQIEGWSYPMELQFHAANPDRTETVDCTHLKAGGEWFAVSETPDEIIDIIQRAIWGEDDEPK